MARPKVERTVYMLNRSVDRLTQYYRDSKSLAPRFQYLVAELVMLRLFSVLEEAIEEVALKLAAGALYTNGEPPTLRYNARSLTDARSAMMNYDRAKSISHLRWGRSTDIRNSVDKVIDGTDPFCRNATFHGNNLNEMRIVRNRVAHVGSDSRARFQQVVRQTYGANRSIQTGVFLTSVQVLPRAKIEDYLGTSRVLVADLARGY